MTTPITFLSTVPFDDVLSGRPRQLAEALARLGDRQVTYVEIPGPLTAARRRFQRAARDVEPKGLSRIRLPSMPKRAALAETRAGRFRSRQVAEALRRSVPDVERGWVVVGDPRLDSVLRHVRPGKLCFDCLDHPRVFAGPGAASYDPARHRQLRELVKRSDLVTWVNPRIQRFLGHDLADPRTCWIANGVPASWVRDELEDRARGDRLDRRREQPVVGFLGALFEWVDLELIADTARRLPEVRFVLCGPARLGSRLAVLRGLPNVVRLDARPHRDARDLLRTFDAGLIPFVRDEVGRCSDPIKLYEYLACGLPVATTLEPVASQPPPSIHIGGGAEQFAQAVTGALDDRSPAGRAARFEFARRNTWERRADELLGAMARATARPSGGSVVSIHHKSDAANRDQLKVLFVVRTDLEKFSGGDTVQILNTARFLRRLGVTVTVTSDPQDSFGPVDCVHLFHLERLHESILPWLRFRRTGIPIVLSPIYWPPSFGSRGPSGARGLLEDGKNLYRLVKAEGAVERRGVWRALLMGWPRARRKLLLGVDMLLPNSRAEAAVLAVESRGRIPIRVVHNAVDSSLCQQILDTADSGDRRDVLSVGHFDPRKNQLGLIRAMRSFDERLVLVGGPRRAHQRYFRRCRREAEANVVFRGTLPRADVLQAMCVSRVHVCPSYYETPGLANLEAASMGCPLVLPECPPVREYFGDGAFYFRPGYRESLGEAIRRALHSDPTNTSEAPDWRTTAEETLAAYEEVLGRDAPRVGGPRPIGARRAAVRSRW